MPFILAVLACSAPNPRVIIATDLGDFVVEIYATQAPVTAENFLRHVDGGHFDGATFYRTVTLVPDNQPNTEVKIEVIQGGMGERPAPFEPIDHEPTSITGLKHLDGTISMARLEPGSASSEFFICIGEQPGLDFGGRRNPDGHGFAAFGRVVSGMDVVRSIHRQPANGQELNPAVSILRVQRIEDAKGRQ